MRRKTIAVRAGDIVFSSEEPVIVQSMLNTSTMDTEACIEQAIRIVRAGARLVRITAQGVREAENLKLIREGLRQRGYTVPLSADIHFSPAAALVAAKYVEKVRINPGNFADKRATFQKLEYTEDEYAAELEVLREKFTEFLDVCREYHTAVRIGTNHGSLSDRIMSRYGNTPAGMVEATMEYLRICRDTDFRDVVISLKSSDCRIMVEAVRLLVRQMKEEGMAYPLHLGVTEAGEGEDGRIRSAVGIGCLLNEGIGDTIRVSLTEAPECEIPVARTLIEVCTPRYTETEPSLTGTEVKPLLVADISASETVDESLMRRLDFLPSGSDPVYGERLKAGTKAPEVIYSEALGPELTKLPEEVLLVVPAANFYMAHVYNRRACPLVSPAGFMEMKKEEDVHTFFVELTDASQITPALAEAFAETPNTVAVLSPAVADYSVFHVMAEALREKGITCPFFIRAKSGEEEPEKETLRLAAHTGGLFVDRLPAGLWITFRTGKDPLAGLVLGRNILQSAGLRRYKAEFVSCPGCGRTLYNLEGAVARVKQAFSHLDKLKIAVMGCVVNGPGEMGDADYGYVGAGNAKVNLYRRKERVKTAVPEEEAIAELEKLIRANGDWKERKN